MGLLIFYAFISIFFSFLCSILEAAFLSFTPSYIRMKKREGKSYAKTIAQFKKDVDQPLIAILTINTIAHTVGAILVGVQAEKVFGGGTAVIIVSTIMTLAILIISEIIPKTIGATYWHYLGNFTAKTLQIIIYPLKYSGILWLMMLTTKLIGKSAHVNTMSREEFLAITDAAEQEGVFEASESSLIKNLMVFKTIKAKDIMTPFSVVVTEEESTTIKDFYNNHKHLQFSRIPVYDGKPHYITGFVLKDEVLEEMINEKGSEPIKILRRDINFTDIQTPIPKLFEILVKNRTHITAVVDEYGNMVGLVTMEDIIETLLGFEIMDEKDSIPDMQVLARQNWEKRAKRMGIIDSSKDDNAN